VKGTGAVLPIDTFVEKPDIDRARQYFESGNYFWNSGIFIWKTSIVIEQYRKLLPAGVGLTKIQRFPFYDKAREPDTALMIATGEQRNWANLLLTMGYVKHPPK
jgi:L-fucose mutarotase/ribose pyranase (RbsD/FucU family)